MDAKKAYRSLNARYMLVDRKIVETHDLLAWAKWFGHAPNRIIEQTNVTPEVQVSTVFLGIDHGFGHHGGPILFETMIFGGPNDGYQDRYRTIEGAEAGHKRVIEMALKPSAESDD